MHFPFALVLTTAALPKILNDAIIERVRLLLPYSDKALHSWLSPGIAYEVLWKTLSLDEAQNIKERIRKTLHPLPIDVNMVLADPELRRKKLLVADMESTIIEQELIDELADFMQKKELMSALTLQTMQGQRDFATSLRHRVKLLTGLHTDAFVSVLSRITETPGAHVLLTRMKARGAKTALVSSGCQYFTERVAHKLGFEHHCGTIWDIKENVLTGEILEPLIDAASKKVHLERLTAEYRLNLADTLAVGDGANDLLMLQTAGLGVAFHAKSSLRTAMCESMKGAIIDHADLRALLALQGEKF